MWTFTQAEEFLKNTAPPGKSNYGLERINHLLDLLGHPEKNFTCVTVAGTNGKGSTAAFLDSLLRAHGVTVACHIKPHLESVTERIRLHGVDSTQAEFAEALFEVKTAINKAWTRDDEPTYFEIIFASFLCAARKAGITVAILEAGLGGRLDAVNSVDAAIVVLTSVDFDHTELLGNTLEEITGEKIVIARKGGVVVCQDNPREVMTVVENYCFANDIRLVNADDSTFLSGFELGLKGPYQPVNASLAVAALEALVEINPGLFTRGSSYGFFEKGLKDARLPGRWEEILNQETGKRYILDGGHNRAGLSGVLGHFKKISAGQGTIIFGLKKTKDHEDAVKCLLDSAGKIIFTKILWPESHDPRFLMAEAERLASINGKSSQIKFYCVDSIKDGIEIAESFVSRNAPTLITGSLYLAGEARSELIK